MSMETQRKIDRANNNDIRSPSRELIVSAFYRELDANLDAIKGVNQRSFASLFNAAVIQDVFQHILAATRDCIRLRAAR
jgi:hypothetical protein